MDIEIKDQAELVAQFRTIHKELGENKTAQARAAADFADQLRKMEERLAFAGKSETAPLADTADLIARYHVDGKVMLRSGRNQIQFAGRSVEVEQEGLFFGKPSTEWDADLKRLALARTAYRVLTGQGSPGFDAKILAHLAKAPTANGFRDAIGKAISDTAGSGAEWIPDVPISTLYEEFYTPNGIAALFPMVNVPAGGLIIPAITDTIRPVLKGVGSNDDASQYPASTPTSSNQTINPAGFAARVVVDDSATEDSIFALLPELQRRIARAMMDVYEDAMINGDTTATHQDAIASWNIRSRWGATGLGGSNDHRRAMMGFRRIAVDRTCTSDLNATQTAAGIMGTLVGGMGERAAADIVFITSPEVMYKKLVVDSNVFTIEKFGPRATIVTGQLAQIGGHPLVVSRWVSADLASTGLFTGSGALSGLLAVDRSAFTHYDKRAVLVESDKDITRGQYNIVATMRRKMVTLSASAQKVAMYGYNMG